jgi:uncharacterized protein YndB with AHSA1/START domain
MVIIAASASAAARQGLDFSAPASATDSASDTAIVPTIAVSREVTKHAGAVWQSITSPAGIAVWLGRGAVLSGVGELYRCDDGAFGMVRTYHPLQQLRLSWHPSQAAAASLIELDLTPLADGTRIRVWHEGVDDAKLAGLRAQWQMRLNGLARLIDG